MPLSLESLGIDRLSVEDRLALVEAIGDGIVAEGAPIPFTDAHRAELDRRIADHEADPGDVEPWVQVKADVRNRLTPRQ